MMKRRRRSASWSRGLQALLVVSCLALAGCAAEAMMEEGEDEGTLADQSGDMAPDEEGTAEEPMEEPAEDEAITSVPGEETQAACLGYGQNCGSSGWCCAGLVCAFDGYVRYCRH